MTITLGTEPGTERERLERLTKLQNLRAAIETEIASLIAAGYQVTAREREVALAARRAKWGSALCGTDGGYYRHRRTFREVPCDDCKAAHAAAEKARAERRAASELSTTEAHS